MNRAALDRGFGRLLKLFESEFMPPRCLVMRRQSVRDLVFYIYNYIISSYLISGKVST